MVWPPVDEDTALNDMAKNLLLWLVIAAVLLSVFNNFNMQTPTEELGYSEFVAEVQRDQVKKVVVDGLTISGERYDGSFFDTIRPMVEDPRLMDDMLEYDLARGTGRVVSNGVHPPTPS